MRMCVVSYAYGVWCTVLRRSAVPVVKNWCAAFRVYHMVLYGLLYQSWFSEENIKIANEKARVIHEELLVAGTATAENTPIYIDAKASNPSPSTYAELHAILTHVIARRREIESAFLAHLDELRKLPRAEQQARRAETAIKMHTCVVELLHVYPPTVDDVPYSSWGVPAAATPGTGPSTHGRRTPSTPTSNT